ncbi:transketolase [Candidatus Magnetomonas plexicatena]|uniref:transketolase n=1 Tax=Candidatus Magnetomonas plexicatena TaxID=2552947 RepID=UPI001C7630D6|nr:transketolase [Nitrospirales bacterium LBB_01]
MNKVDELCVNTIRMLAIDAVQRANSGHPGMPMGDADMAYVLWTKFLKHNPKDAVWPNRDRFILSAGHGSMMLYSLLYLTGYNISIDDIKNFRKMDSCTPGHPEYCLSTGVEVSTGPLGFGFAVGVGMAMAEKYLADTFNRPGFDLVDYNIYGIVSDGDIMEGVSYEASSIAGHLKLGKLIYLYSANKTTIDGSTDLTFTEDVGMRFESQHWHVQYADGYNHEELYEVIEKAKAEKNRPSIIIVKTHLGYGSPNKQDSADIHGAPLGTDEVKATKAHFNWPQEEFYVPKEALEHCRTAISEGAKQQSRWLDLLDRYRQAFPKEAELWDTFMSGKINVDLGTLLPVYEPGKSVATRTASGAVVNALAGTLLNLLGGSADLSPSNQTFIKGKPIFAPGESGRNIHFGIREFSMASIATGIALSRCLIPYVGTYLVFSSYMMPSVRMCSMMGLKAIFILTHDSIGVGEDGPSHHPVEQLTTMRAIPELTVIRPADANETVRAWQYILQHGYGTTALVLTRQNVPVIDRNKYAKARGIYKGAYVLADSGKPPELILMASGSEIHCTLEAYEELVKEGAAVRIVNMASFELFEKQMDDYKSQVFPPSVEKRIAVEAASSLSWYKYVGLKGKVIGVDRFGLSAPSDVLFEHFGFTASNILKVARELLKT